ncbi:long-chain-fatty-acid--CoA ligase [Acetobacteraceae bacterium KSS8]|uniref:Long-chain-fatty-acid--CoA ligase n=1 Tax=Endosaccharibacter trunci TaxID=2812733 RepID=A0ABT1W8L0_9PROT|nr:long-chain-fatty-acid--CoA ligase [Acetobacteraceae bacterium KSS8]
MSLRFAERAPDAHGHQLLIGRLLDSVLQTAPDQEIVYRDRVRLTYRSFHDRLGRLANTLGAAGAGEGTVVAVMDWDSHRYLECYFAVPMMGAVIQTVNVRLPPAQVLDTLDRAEAEILLVHRDFLPLLAAMGPLPERVRAFVLLEDERTGAPIPSGFLGEYEALLAKAAPEHAFGEFDENAIATTFFTSGTTGRPKAVQFSHRQIVLHTLAALGPWGNSPGTRTFGIADVYMPLTPMFHVHAWGMPYVATLLGVKQVYPGRYEPDTILKLHQTEGVTFSHCVPTVLGMVLEAAARSGADLAGWLMVIGGAPLPPTLFRAGRAKGMELVVGYGMSETAPTLTISRPLPGVAEETALLSAGMPVPLVALRVVDEHGQTVPADDSTRGELVVRAPWLTQAYAGDAAASEALWRGGWLHTGDVATQDRFGTLRIRDRLRDVIKSGGEWLCSTSIEHVLLELDGVAEVAVVGVPHPRWGERPVAVVVAKPGLSVSTEAANALLDQEIAAGRLSRYARLDRVDVVEALPRTSVGKIDKKLLRAARAATAETAASV